MSWLDLPRIPEPEVMDDSREVQAYSSASAQEYLGKIDDSFVEHALRLVDRAPGWVLDIGCGPGQIVKKISMRLPQWRYLGVDRSEPMIRRALEPVESSSALSAREGTAFEPGDVQFLIGDANSLPFRDATFDLVLCNSVLHHIHDPSRLLAEIGRVAKSGAAILLRDLRRPSRVGYAFHVRWHGRHYAELMYKLYCDSVRAAYTPEELSSMLRSAGMQGASVFTYRSTHLGIERAARRTR